VLKQSDQPTPFGYLAHLDLINSNEVTNRDQYHVTGSSSISLRLRFQLAVGTKLVYSSSGHNYTFVLWTWIAGQICNIYFHFNLQHKSTMAHISSQYL
jgi:hypothetical protein